MYTTSPPRAWAEIDLQAIRHNLGIIKKSSPTCAIMPVVKASAYGHGLEAVARTLDSEGITYFGVANVGEARRLKLSGCRTKPYILGATFPEEREELVENDWCSFVSTIEDAQHFQALAAQYGKKLKMHISIDVGMGRGGFLPNQLHELIAHLPELPNLIFEGIGAHLPAADEDHEATLEQIRLFEESVTTLRQSIDIKWVHIANSAASLAYQIPSANLARPGLALYGISPIESQWTDQLKPALSLHARLTVVRNLPENHTISYGSTFRTSHASKIATVGIGYADGYFRSLANKNARVIVHGISCPVLGRVTMDQIIIDVSEVPNVYPGDIAEILGPNVPVTELAEKAGTIPWEIFTSIGARIPRIYQS